MVVVKEKVESRCGICCSQCHFQEEVNCKGCIHISKPFLASIWSITIPFFILSIFILSFLSNAPTY